MPKNRPFRYTKENPYISNGKGRNSKKDKAYIGVDADVCEFEDLYFNAPWNNGVNKMGLGIDEFVPASINVSRKNYIDLLDAEKQEIKLVGNTIKSRRMSGYIEKFIDKACLMLLYNKGQEFINAYYDYIDDIYNYRIPLRDIAAKGKIKKTIAEYKKDCETLTKAGNKKSRQAWYELVILNNIKVDISDTVYYVNIGTKLSEKDVKRVTHQYVKLNDEIVELTPKIKKEVLKKALGVEDVKMKDYKGKEVKELIAPYIVKEEDEIILNCQLVPTEIVEASEDIMCNDKFEYNVAKYIDQFNSRIRPLLVCFSKDIRDKILIDNPENRQYFTKEQCTLIAGEPFEDGDQDTYEQLMKPERKEIEYWLSINEIPPFVKECEIDWDKLVAEYKELKKQEDDAVFQEENKQYLEIINSLTLDEVKEFEEEGTIPSRLNKIVTLQPDMYFVFNKIPNMHPTTGGYIFDDIQYLNQSDEIEEKYSLG